MDTDLQKQFKGNLMEKWEFFSQQMVLEKCISTYKQHVHPWLIHVSVWQNHYNTVISFQLK